MAPRNTLPSPLVPRPQQETVEVPIRPKGTLEEDFELIRLIERGGFGDVLLYKTNAEQKMFAIKSVTINEDNCLEECEREVRYRNVLKHKNLVECVDVWKEILSPQVTRLYIQMEFCPGGSLRQAISRGDFQTNRKLIYTVLEGALLGLEFLHYRNFMHRDIKPENIVFNRYNVPKIVDFGLIRNLVFRSQRSVLTEGVGTGFYIAPEVFGWMQNHLHYTTKVDIFSLGVVFFEIFLSLDVTSNVEHVKLVDDLKMKIISIAGSRNNNNIVRQFLSPKTIPLPPILGRSLPKTLSSAASQLIRSMLEPSPDRRLSAGELLEGASLRTLKRLTAPVASASTDTPRSEHLTTDDDSGSRRSAGSAPDRSQSDPTENQRYVNQRTSLENGLRALPATLQLPSTSVSIQQPIYNGPHASVSKGKILGWPSSATVIYAVKSGMGANAENVLHEAQILSELKHHDNIIKLHGVYHKEIGGRLQIQIVLEHCASGQLAEFLQSKQESFFRVGTPGYLVTNKNLEQEKQHTTEKAHLVNFALQTAKGMKHLHEKQILHCDLTISNILVTENLTCKIADFKTAVKAQDDLVRRVGPFAMDVLYMAPEAMQHGLFTSKSDVWSFGVLLYSLFSHGAEPHRITLQPLRENVRLPRPRDCPAKIYDDLMLYCWRWEAEERPNSQRIVDLLEKQQLTPEPAPAGDGYVVPSAFVSCASA